MSKKGRGSIGCILFPFVMVGTIMSYLYFADVINWARMQKWKEVPAKIISARLDVSESTTRSRAPDGSLTGGTSRKSITYKALAEYEYEYQGKKYIGTKVSRYFGSDNIGHFYEKIYQQLSEFEKSGRPFRCYVNPASPQESILFRQMRLGMLCIYAGLGGVLGGIGWGMLAGMVASFVRNKRDPVLKKQHPQEPWKWRKDWIRGEARTEASSGMFIVVASSLFAAAFSIPILFFAVSGLLAANFVALLALIFPLVASFVIKSAIESVLQWMRFGRAVFQLNSIPSRPGERLRGIISTGGMLPGSAKVELELYQVKKRTGDKSKWIQKTTTTPTTGIDGKPCIQVDMEIPEQKSNEDWELRAFSKISGVDLDARFKVPIFRQ